MPAKKPQGLNRRHNTKAENADRVAREDSVTPEVGLPMSAPARLKEHAVAAGVWRRLMRLYSSLEAVVVTALDQDQLIDYCLLMETAVEVLLMRKTTYRMWLELGVAHDRAIDKAKEAAEAAKKAVAAANESGAEMPEKGIGSLTEVEKWEDRAVMLACKSLDACKAVERLDVRFDQKCKTLSGFRQTLYLTSRSRAGASPAKKEEPEPKGELESILDDVDSFLNGDGK
jgi:hypothetical protein